MSKLTRTLSVDLTTLHYRHLEAYCQVLDKPMKKVLEEIIEALKLPPTVDPEARKSFINIEQRAFLCFKEIQAQAELPSAQASANQKQEATEKRESAKQREAQAFAELQATGEIHRLDPPSTVTVGQLYLMAIGGNLRLVEVVDLPPGKVVFKTADDGRQQPRRNLANFLPYARGPVSPYLVQSLTKTIQGQEPTPAPAHAPTGATRKVIPPPAALKVASQDQGQQESLL